MSDDSVVSPPPEANDSRLSSNEKDAFLANAPETPRVTDAVATEQEPPEEHKHRTYDVKARGATEEDADFEADSDADENAEDDE